MRHSNKIVFASTNGYKFNELNALLNKEFPDVELVPVAEVIRNSDKLALVENHKTYLENAIAKARLANHGAHFPTLADDSGLEVLSLEGRPGVRSHRFAIAKAGMSQDQANCDKLMQELKGKSGTERKARFVCALALVMEGTLITAEGVMEGRIADSASGTNGFGYDPIFIPDGKEQSFAELTQDEKNHISHRGRAFESLAKKIKALGIQFTKP